LSPGGIVDIEFITQILQLKYGYLDKHLRDSNTSKALKALRDKGHISELEYSKLIDAYHFLRSIESRLRIVEDMPLDIMPSDKDSLNRLARRVGYRGRCGIAGDRLYKDFKRKLMTVRRIYDKILLSI
jgi:glutamate-ammonia-ligase adenylyltransferase